MDFAKPSTTTDGSQSGLTTPDMSNIRPVYILVQNPVTSTSNEKHFEKTFPRKVVLILAAIQLVSCAMSFISEVKTTEIQIRLGKDLLPKLIFCGN